MTGTIPDTLRTGRWQHRGSLTNAGFEVRNFGIRTVRGAVPVREAWVDVDASGNPVGVHAVLDLAGIDTGNTKRDADLRKPKLLDTAKHPTLTFASGRPEPTQPGWQVPGRLEGRAATDVVLEAGIVNRAESGELSVRATVTIDRRALGVRAPRLLIGRQVTATIDAVFQPPR
jgi:polyisoprenoid-binding protein YceI